MKRVIISAFLACSYIWAQSGLTVEAFDEQSNNNTQLTLRLRLKNNTAETLKNVQAKYLIERDDSRTLNVYPYYMPNATYSVETLSDYLVVNINVDEIAPGTYPNESGISLGMVYSDGKNFYKDTDYSYPGKGNFNAAPNIVVMQNGVWLTGELPSSMPAAKLRIKAIQPENSDTRSAWVEIENYGQESVNLSRFILKNSESHSASIGDFSLKHGEKLRVCQDIALECPADDFSTVIQSLTFGNEGELKLALGSKTVDYVAWGKQGSMGDFEPLPTRNLAAIGMYESYYKGAFYRYIDIIGWKLFGSNEIQRADDGLPLAREYNMPDNSVAFLSANQKPRFSWVNVKGADSYTLNVYSSTDKSLIYQVQTELNYADVDLPSGSYLWNVVPSVGNYGFESYITNFDDFALYEIHFENDEISTSGRTLLNAPKLGARKDTRMLATDMGAHAKAYGWDRVHTLSEKITPEEEWRCWAVAFNVLNKFYKGTLTQDEIKILGMIEANGGVNQTLFYFPLGPAGGLDDTYYPALFSKIFKVNAKLNYLEKGLKLNSDKYEKLKDQVKEKDIDVAKFKKNLENGKPIMVGTVNPGGSGHVMIIDGYATSNIKLCKQDGDKACVVKIGDPLFHFINLDNNGDSRWVNADAFVYDFYYIMEKPSFVLDRDPLLALANPDSDGDNVIDYDEIKRFGSEADDEDSDGDGISDYAEIFAMTNRCVDLMGNVVDEKGNVVDKMEVGCRNFMYYDSDGDKYPTYYDYDSDNGGVYDGMEDVNGNGIRDEGELDPYNSKDDKFEVTRNELDLPDDITIYGYTRVLLNDNVECYNSASTENGFCNIANEYKDTFVGVILGVKAKVNNIYTRSGVWLRRANVSGNVNLYTLPSYKNAIERQEGATVKGEIKHLNTIAYPFALGYNTLSLSSQPEREHVVKNGEVFEWDDTEAYKELKVEAGGKLILNPGDYIASRLILDRGSELEFTKPGEATRVIAMDYVDWRTTITNEDLVKVARGFKLITYMTDQRLFSLGTNWAGTLYAPKTYVIFGQGRNKEIYGRFLADIAIVHQTSKIFRVDYDPIVPEVEEEDDDQETVVAENDNPSEDDVIGDGLFKQRPANENVVSEVVAKSSFAAELKGFSRNGISFETKSAGIVKISIMSANGIVVKSVSTGNLEAGKHSVAWNSENVPSGRYLVTLSQNGKVSGKFVMLK